MATKDFCDKCTRHAKGMLLDYSTKEQIQVMLSHYDRKDPMAAERLRYHLESSSMMPMGIEAISIGVREAFYLVMDYADWDEIIDEYSGEQDSQISLPN